MSKSHTTQAALISNEVQKPLENYMSSFKAKKRTIESTIMKIVKYKKALNAKLETCRSKYESECMKFRAMSADKMLLDGNELRKLNSKLEKSEQTIKHYRQEYYDMYKEAFEVHERYVREWRLALVKYQELEEERIKFLRSNIWTYCNLVSVTCVNVDTSCENIRLSLEKCDAKREIELFTKKFGTGNDIPGAPKFIDYINSASLEEDKDEPSTNAMFSASTLPSTESYATVKIAKKAPTQQPSEQSNAFLMLGRRNNELMKEFDRRSEEEEDQNGFGNSISNSISNGQIFGPTTPSPTDKIINTPVTKLNPPESDYSDRSSSQFNSHSSSQYPHTSKYSASTDMSVHNDNEAGEKKHWNSPQRRRRSRGSIQALSDYSSSGYEPNQSKSKRKSFTLERDDDVKIDDDDILRSTLRDLQLGGNGNMEALKKSIRPKSMVLDSQMKTRTQEQKQRPKSVTLDNHVTWDSTTRPKSNALPKFGPLTGRPVIRYCKAIYSYKAKEEDECSFKKRDTILVLEDDDLWWSVEVLGKQDFGQAPSNYLAPL